MSPQRLLITTGHLRNLAGSEMVALELIEEFLGRGWAVDVFTNKLGDPMRAILGASAGDLRVSISSTLDRPPFAGPYDLIWVQHALLPDELIARAATEGIQEPMIWHHLSTFLPLEMPRAIEIEVGLGTLSTAMCEQAGLMIEQFGIPRDRIAIFENPAPTVFGDAERLQHVEDLSRLLVVSNHLPQEIRDAVEVLRARGVLVDVVGMEDHAMRVNPALLSSVDAVLTIGKTVQYALSMGIPCYVYDHFGGPGWLTEKVFDAERSWAFSGKSSRRRLSAQQIVEEVVGGFAPAAKYAAENRPDFAERWRLSHVLDELINDPRMHRGTPAVLSGADAHRFTALGHLLYEQQCRADAAETSHAQSRQERERWAQLQYEVQDILASRSWRISAPLRVLRWPSSRRWSRLVALTLNIDELEQLKLNLLATRSWRWTAMFRRTSR